MPTTIQKTNGYNHRVFYKGSQASLFLLYIIDYGRSVRTFFLHIPNVLENWVDWLICCMFTWVYCVSLVLNFSLFSHFFSIKNKPFRHLQRNSFLVCVMILAVNNLESRHHASVVRALQDYLQCARLLFCLCEQLLIGRLY